MDKLCHNCGKPLTGEGLFCASCGASQPDAGQTKPKPGSAEELELHWPEELRWSGESEKPQQDAAEMELHWPKELRWPDEETPAPETAEIQPELENVWEEAPEPEDAAEAVPEEQPEPEQEPVPAPTAEQEPEPVPEERPEAEEEEQLELALEQEPTTEAPPEAEPAPEAITEEPVPEEAPGPAPTAEQEPESAPEEQPEPEEPSPDAPEEQPESAPADEDFFESILREAREEARREARKTIRPGSQPDPEPKQAQKADEAEKTQKWEAAPAEPIFDDEQAPTRRWAAEPAKREEKPKPAAVRTPPREAPSGGSRKGVLIAAVILVLLLALGGVAVWKLLPARATLVGDNYVSLTFSGSDGYGAVQVTVDGSRLATDAQKLLQGEGAAQIARTLDLMLWSCCEAEPASGLTNGQTVTVHWDPEAVASLNKKLEPYGCRVACSDMTETVSGLSETKAVDPFASLIVRFEGTDGAGWAELDQAVDEMYLFLDFSLEQNGTQTLKNGDVVTVLCTGGTDEELARRYGVTLTRRSAQYTVSGLAEAVAVTTETIDPFEWFYLSADGDTVRFMRRSDAPEWLASLEIVEDTFEDVEQGDTLTLELAYKEGEDAFESHWGVKPGSMSHEYTVGQTETVTSLDEITAPVLAEIRRAAEACLAETEFGGLTVKKQTYLGLWLFTADEDVYYPEYGDNFVVAVYEETLADEDGEEITLYVTVMLEKLLTTEDGLLTDVGEAEFMEYNGLSCVVTAEVDGYTQSVKLYGFANLSVARALGTIVPSLLDVEGEYAGKTTIRR